jgi:UDP-N-acetylmuramyl pentapeptide synthase
MELASKNIKSKNILKFANSTEAGEQILKNLADNDIIYIKGSRGTRMEKIIENLTKTQNAH